MKRKTEISTDLEGKKAYKNRGFYAGIIGILQRNENCPSGYVIVYKGGCRGFFLNENEITIVD